MNNSVNSPKHQFVAELYFSRPLGSLGSTIAVTMDEQNERHDTVQYYLRMARQNKVEVTIVWKQNLKKFPEFDWKEIGKYIRVQPTVLVNQKPSTL